MDNESKTLDWGFWPKSFEKINKLDEITSDSLLEVLQKYKQANRSEIWVKHQHFGQVARVKNFVLDCKGNIEYIYVWKDTGGWAAWSPDKCRLENRPTKKRKKIVKSDTNGCKKHPNYTGKRKPRTDCQDCLKIYEINNSGKSVNKAVKRADESNNKGRRKSNKQTKRNS